MKKILLFILSFLMVLPAFGLRLTLEQQVSRREKNRQLTWDYRDKAKSVSRKKTFTVKIEEVGKTDVIVFFFMTAGGEFFSDIQADTVSRQHPLSFKYYGSGQSSNVRIAFKQYGWGDDFILKSGNDKVEACVFVYDQKTGKLLDDENTNGYFKDQVLKGFKDKIQQIVSDVKADYAKGKVFKTEFVE